MFGAALTTYPLQIMPKHFFRLGAPAVLHPVHPPATPMLNSLHVMTMIGVKQQRQMTQLRCRGAPQIRV